MPRADLIPDATTDLAREFAGTLGTLNAVGRRHDRLVAHGCANVARAWMTGGPVGQARGLIQPLVGGRHVWVPDPEGVLLAVLPVTAEEPYFDHPDGIIDILAWSARRPEVMATRNDAAAWLPNRTPLEMAMWGGPALRVYRHAWSWLLAGAPDDGAVMLDPDVALDDLRLLRRVGAEDAAHAAELAEAIQRWALKGLPVVTWSELSAQGAGGKAA